MFKSLIFGFAVALLFVGNVGVDVFKHICEEDGISVSYVINTIEHCEDHQEELPECCQDKHEDDCCDDEVAYYHVKLDFFEHFQIQLSAPVFVVPSAFEETQQRTRVSEIQFFNNTDPPPIQLSRRLSIIQSYLI